MLDELAPLLGEKLRIGKVDATVHKRVAKEHKIQAYPTLKFKRKGQAQLLEYDGSRSKEGLIAFANRLDAPSPQVITSASELNALKEENEVVFLLVVPSGGERPAIQDAFNTIAENNKHWLAFAVATSDVVKDEFRYVPVDAHSHLGPYRQATSSFVVTGMVLAAARQPPSSRSWRRMRSPTCTRAR